MKYFIRTLSVLFSLISLSACGDGAGEKASGPVADVASVEPASSVPRGEMEKGIESLTGAHTRIVWAMQQNPEKTDAHANGKAMLLYGLDTRDGKGERVILPDAVQSYARPMITPDGARIVFTDKGVSKKKKKKGYDPVCYVVNWDGSGLKELRDGYADDIWVDPETGKFWVYTAVDFITTETSAVKSRGMERFLLDDPKTVETIFDKEVSPNNAQVSRDGKRIAALFPWPDAGLLNTDDGKWQKTGRGCWTSIAPDNSYLSWVFDGAHQNVTMVHPNGEDTWVVPLNSNAPVKGREVYHPRWSNHPRIMVISGPYWSGSRSGPGKDVQLYLGKFDPGMTKIETWVQATKNDLADVFPDVWVSGGEKVSLSVKHLGKAGVKESEVADAASQAQEAPKTEVKPTAGKWPGQTENAAFVWRNIRSNHNTAGDRNCNAEPRGRARFTREFGMLVDGGWFNADSDSVDAILEAVSGPAASFEMLVTPNGTSDGEIFRCPEFSVVVSGGRYIALTPAGGIDLGTAEAGKAAHIAVARDADQWAGYRDGARVKDGADRAANTGAVRFGDGTWNGGIEAVAVFSTKADEARLAANAKALLEESSKRTPAERHILKGKLIEITEARTKEEIGAYRRAIVVNTYEIVEGELGGKKDVLVAHYVYMDGDYLASIKDRKVGEVYDLVVEPKDEHTEIKDELYHYDGLDFESPIFFDVATPMP